MRMSKQMRELKDQISAALPLLSAAVENQDAEAAEKYRLKQDALNSLYAAAEAEFNARRGLETDPNDNPDGDGAVPAKNGNED